MLHCLTAFPIGSTFLAFAADRYGAVVRARRTVNADGSPRAGLTAYRVVGHATPPSLSASMLIECGLTRQRGAYSLLEVVS